MLSWSQQDLAARSSVSEPTIRGFERGRTTAYPGTVALLAMAFQRAGIGFSNGPEGDGVTLRRREAP